MAGAALVVPSVSRFNSPLISPGLVNWLATAAAPASTTATVKLPLPKAYGAPCSSGRRNQGSNSTRPSTNHRARRGTSCHQSRPTSHNDHRVLANSTSAYSGKAARRPASSNRPVRAMPMPLNR